MTPTQCCALALGASLCILSLVFTSMHLELDHPALPELQRPSRKGKERDLMHRDSSRDLQPTDLDEKLIALRRRTALCAPSLPFCIAVLTIPAVPTGQETGQTALYRLPHLRRLAEKDPQNLLLKHPLDRRLLQDGRICHHRW